MPLENFTLPTAKDDSDRKLLDDVEKYGWHVVQISEDDQGPAYAFTVGLFYSYGHPELLVMGLKSSVSHDLLWTTVGHVMTGKKFQKGEVTDLLAENYNSLFLEIPVSRYQEYLGYAIWFYRSLARPFPALQIVWPDKSGKFPHEPGFDERFFSLQHVIDEEADGLKN